MFSRLLTIAVQGARNALGQEGCGASTTTTLDIAAFPRKRYRRDIITATVDWKHVLSQQITKSHAGLDKAII